MQIHYVRAGECFSAIAARHGYRDPRKLYEHPANADLRRKRPDYNLLRPGDEVHIPDPSPRVHDVATGQTHVFRMPAATKAVSLRFLAPDGAPRAGLRYVFRVDGEPAREGVTDGHGAVTHEVGLDVEEVLIDLPPDESYRLRVGALDPMDDPEHGYAGVRQRLTNLGFDGAPDDADSDRARHAVAAFQLAHDLPPTGVVDEATRRALAAAHGG